jgi:hypothetical protein
LPFINENAKNLFIYLININITFSSNLQVIATGTIEPFLIFSLISLPKLESGLAASSRRRSPADK